MSSMASTFVHTTRKHSQSASCKKWHNLVPLDGFPLFKHHSIASSCAALQYETETMFFHRAVSEKHDIENHKIPV